MAQQTMMVTIENTTDAVKYLVHPPVKGGAFEQRSTTVPRTTREKVKGPEGEDVVKATPGSATIEASLWSEMKKNPVVAAYLSKGHLRVAGSSGPPTAQAPAAVEGGSAGR